MSNSLALGWVPPRKVDESLNIRREVVIPVNKASNRLGPDASAIRVHHHNHILALVDEVRDDLLNSIDVGLQVRHR